MQSSSYQHGPSAILGCEFVLLITVLLVSRNYMFFKPSNEMYVFQI